MTTSSEEEALAWHTYHCVCAQLLFATTSKLSSLPKRKSDKATILPLSSSPVRLSPGGHLHAAALREPFTKHLSRPSGQPTQHGAGAGHEQVVTKITGPEVVIALDDGFEKRTLLRCTRCGGVWAYALDADRAGGGAGAAAGPREDVAYVLKGSTSLTEKMLASEDKG